MCGRCAARVCSCSHHRHLAAPHVRRRRHAALPAHNTTSRMPSLLLVAAALPRSTSPRPRACTPGPRPPSPTAAGPWRPGTEAIPRSGPAPGATPPPRRWCPAWRTPTCASTTPACRSGRATCPGSVSAGASQVGRVRRAEVARGLAQRGGAGSACPLACMSASQPAEQQGVWPCPALLQAPTGVTQRHTSCGCSS